MEISYWFSITLVKVKVKVKGKSEISLQFLESVLETF